MGRVLTRKLGKVYFLARSRKARHQSVGSGPFELDEQSSDELMWSVDGVYLQLLPQ